jgi:5-methylcytosine-specific restriction endonuclease McrA
MQAESYKRCTRCDQTKPFEGFYALRSGRLSCYCKPCARDDARARYHAGGVAARTTARERMRRERKRHPDRARARDRARNPEKKRAKDRRYREGLSEAGRARLRENYRRWLERHPDEARDASRSHAAAHAARKREAFVEFVHPLVVLERHDGTCGICGEDVDPFCFEVDHIRPLVRGGAHSYANTQPAHPLCNRSKGAR